MNVIQDAEYELVQSEWIIIHDGITGTIYEYNSKTGERRPYSGEENAELAP